MYIAIGAGLSGYGPQTDHNSVWELGGFEYKL